MMEQTKSGGMEDNIQPTTLQEAGLEELEGWEGGTFETDKTPLIDSGLGKTITIRTFEYNVNPTLKELPTRQELFNHHSKQIQTILWSDGLRPLDDYAPRVIIDTKRRMYKIFVVCQARNSQVFAENPLNVSEQLTKENATTRH